MKTLTKPAGFELSVIQKELWSSGNAAELYSQLTIELGSVIDKERLARAIGTVVQKNDVLRSRLLASEDSIFPFQFTVEEVDINLESDLDAVYDPQQDDPIRFDLTTAADGKHLLVVRLYALWGDNYSCMLFCRDLCNEYAALQQESAEDVIEYKNFSKWQNDLVNEPDAEAAAFWKTQELFLQQGLLPFEKPATAHWSPAKHRVLLDAAAVHSGGEVQDVLFSACCRYFGRFNENAITVGFTPFKRNYDELNSTVGLICRPLPVTFKSGDDVVKLKDEVLSWSDYFSLERNEHPFIPYSFEYVKPEHEGAFKLADLYTVTDRFILKLLCLDLGDKIALDIYYDESRLNKQDIEVISAQLEWTINASSKSLSEKEKSIIATANSTQKDFNLEKTVIALFEEQVRQHPGAVALVDGETRLTYKELHEKVNAVASFLHTQYGVQKGDTVAILLERSYWLVAAVLAVLKAGAAYVPIDPQLPAERVAYIVDDCGAKLVISEQNLIASVSTPAFDITVPFSAGEASFPALSSADLAYIIYTSGSTGKPKGCVLTHGNLSNYIQSAGELYVKGTPYGNCGLITSISFDLTVTCLFLPLTRGKKLFIGNRKAELIDLLQAVFVNPELDTIKLTPAHLLLLKSLNLSDTHVRVVIVGGEQLTQEQVNAVWTLNSQIKIYNEYGPTETTVGSIVKEIKRADPKILIGQPLCNTQVVILNKAGEPAAIGERGEIHIAGAGVAKGYLNRDELSAQKFIDGPQGRMYKTGDIGRWLPDGNIEYLGRNDDQVKLRGYRIEPGEIETALQGYASLESALVLVKKLGDELQLVAYFTAKEKLDAASLREFLDPRLPSYMVPAHFVQLEQFPLTANGKIDKAALPEVSAAPLSGAAYVAPRNAIERTLVEVYEDVLKKQPIGIRDDFFMLGGDSIKSIQLVARLKQKGYSLVIRDVLTSPVIEDLAGKVKLSARSASQEVVTGMIPLSPIQAAFFENTNTEPHHFNQSVLLQSKEPLDVTGLKQVFDKIVTHHDALRMVFRQTETGWVQENKGLEQTYSFEVVDVFSEDYCQQVQSSINLETGPLFKVVLFGTDRLLMVAHHLIIDGVSWRILFEDISTLYQQYLSGEALSLPQKSDSFKFWQQREQNFESSYWDEVEAAAYDELPAEGRNLVQDVATIHFTLDEAQTTSLLTKCYNAYKTGTNDVLLAALSLGLKETFGISNILIALEGHGREQLDADVDVSRTVGWFTSVYPVVLKVTDADAIKQLVSVKETLHRVPEKGIGYGVLRYSAGKDYKLNPQISFNYLGDFGAGLQTGAGTLFTFSNEPHGREASANRQRETVLDVSGMVVAGKLNISVSYSNCQFEAHTIEQLANAYRQQLQGLINQLSAETKEYLTPSDLTYPGLAIEELAALTRQHEVEDVYVLSPLQEGMYYQWLVSPDTSIYFDQVTCRIKGKLDIAALQQSYQQLVARHAVLRTSFTHQYAGRSLQVVSKNVESAFIYQQLSGDVEAQVHAARAADRARGFQLNEGSQMRLTVLCTAADTYEFIWSHHHILMDGWCLGLLIKEFFEIYHALAQGQTPALEKAYPYANYIKWLNSKHPAQSLEYWRNYLAGYETGSYLPKAPGNASQQAQHEIGFALDAVTTQAIKHLCATLGVTESTFFHVAWAALLARYNNTNDVVFGSVVSGRPAELEGIENMVGLFINTIPVRVNTAQDESFDAQLKAFHKASLQSNDHHYTQLAHVQSATALGAELFDHILVFENYPVEEMLEKSFGAGEQLSLVSATTSSTDNFGFTVVVLPGKETNVKFLYDASLYQQQQVQAMQQHFKNIIRGIAEQPSATVNSLEYIGEDERYKLLHELNDTVTFYPADKTIVQLFCEQAAKTPGNIALVFGDKKYSYSELDERSNQLAHYLRQNYSISPGTPVGVQLERSERNVIAMLGVLKAGGAYVPMDPGYPAERTSYMMDDSKLALVIDNQQMEAFTQAHSKYSKDSLPSFNQPGDVAIVLYTSGSTGKPKGVMLPHTGIVRMVRDTNYLSVNPADVVLSLSNFIFDGSTFDIYSALLNGATLVIAGSDQLLNPDALHKLIAHHKVSCFLATTALFNIYADADNLSLDTVHTVMFGGEMVSLNHVKKFKEKFPAVRLLHMYGPSENSTYSTWFEVKEVAAESKTIPIGTPISNTQVYILDAAGMPAPFGIAGEICIGGPGLAHGYINKPELTAEKFVANPFRPGETMYKSGDMGKWRPEGVMEILGRKDDQVKIRGFRIELGEIENRLNAYPGVEASAVITIKQDSGDRELAAYVVSKNTLDAQDMLAFLSRSLPAYMLPVQLMQLDQLPLNFSGKVDKKKLAGIQGQRLARQKECIAPRNETEATLVNTWRKILDKQEVGINYDFFETGGDSIKVIRLISELRKQLGWQLTVADVYSHRTIEALVTFYSTQNQQQQNAGQSKKEKEALVNEQIAGLKERVLGSGRIAAVENVEDVFPMSDISKGMIHESLVRGAGVYHDQVVLQRNFPGFDLQRLKAVVDLLAATQPVLRSEFNMNDHEMPVQIVRKKVTVPVQYEVIAHHSRQEQEALIRQYLATGLQQPFDVSAAPLWKISVFNLGDDEHVFIWQAHHAIIDGFSSAVFIDSFFNYYQQLGADSNYQPPALQFSYKDFVVQQEVDRLDDSVTGFWQQELADFTPVDLFEPQVEPTSYAAYLGKDYYSKVKYAAEWLGTDVKSLSFSAYLYMLGILSGSNKLVAGLVTHTRPAHEDSEKIIGCFLNTIPFKLDVLKDEPSANWVKRVHAKMIQLKAYERLSMLEIARIHSDKLAAGNPFFDAIFNYVNYQDFRALNDEAPKEQSGTTKEIRVQSNFRTNTYFDFTVSTTGGQYNINLDQVKKLRSGFPAERIIDLYLTILNFLIEAPAANITQLEIVSEAEQRQLLVDFNNTKTVYPAGKTVHELFEEQVKATPGNTAIVYGNESITYAALNEQANKLAHFIKTKYAVTRGELVGLQLPRTPQAVVAMLAIVKAGGAYIPIDMDYPEERVNFIKQDANCRLVITEAELQAASASGTADLPCVNSSNDLAYVIYTSGSTGLPKGVMVEHAAIVRLVKNTNYVSLTEHDCVLSLSNFVFDGSTFDIYGALLNGAKLVIPGKEALLDPEAINTLVQANKVSVFFITTALFNTFIDSGAIDFSGVRQIFFGGELVSVSHVRQFMQKYPSVELVHVYGPTENTTFSSYYPIKQVVADQPTIPIGMPIANSECYVLNAFNRLVPVGVTGEICVSGDGLARGYLNRDELTKEKFVPHPYKPGQMMYKTGDAGKWLPDGSIEFIGRNDDQVKIRGHRIEIGEIEKLLLKHELVRETIVIAAGEGTGKYLCAYFTASQDLSASQLRAYLHEQLPAYMVPAYFMQIEKMPLTKNGKVDKKALPAPELTRANNYTAPRNEVEAKLTDIWSDVLGVARESISVNSNFFEWGGHSLKANTLVTKIHQQMGAKLPIAEVFKKPTVEELAELVENALWVKSETPETEHINEIEI
jgi:amino acid adenylation domain-containing protein/non-ribosomal peptide synthase protein (TIGR01720 family)